MSRTLDRSIRWITLLLAALGLSHVFAGPVGTTRGSGSARSVPPNPPPASIRGNAPAEGSMRCYGMPVIGWSFEHYLECSYARVTSTSYNPTIASADLALRRRYALTSRGEASPEQVRGVIRYFQVLHDRMANASPEQSRRIREAICPDSPRCPSPNEVREPNYTAINELVGMNLEQLGLSWRVQEVTSNAALAVRRSFRMGEASHPTRDSSDIHPCRTRPELNAVLQPIGAGRNATCTRIERGELRDQIIRCLAENSTGLERVVVPSPNFCRNISWWSDSAEGLERMVGQSISGADCAVFDDAYHPIKLREIFRLGSDSLSEIFGPVAGPRVFAVLARHCNSSESLPRFRKESPPAQTESEGAH